MYNFAPFYEDIMKTSLNSTSILIVGCGWLGKIVAERLFTQGAKIFGTTRSKDQFVALEKKNIEPVQFELIDAKNSKGKLPKCNWTIISLAPGRGEGRKEFPGKIEQLVNHDLDPGTKVILFSSTSVYNDFKGVVTEDQLEPSRDSENTLLRVEGIVRESFENSIILRLSGLYGYDRHPVFHLAGRKGIKHGEAPVNLIHADDISEVISKIIHQDISGEIFNLSGPDHTPKGIFYQNLAKKFGLEKPEFLEGGKSEKQIDGTKVTKLLDFEYKHTDLSKYTPNEFV